MVENFPMPTSVPLKLSETNEIFYMYVKSVAKAVHLLMFAIIITKQRV